MLSRPCIGLCEQVWLSATSVSVPSPASYRARLLFAPRGRRHLHWCVLCDGPCGLEHGCDALLLRRNGEHRSVELCLHAARRCGSGHSSRATLPSRTGWYDHLNAGGPVHAVWREARDAAVEDAVRGRQSHAQRAQTAAEGGRLLTSRTDSRAFDRSMAASAREPTDARH